MSSENEISGKIIIDGYTQLFHPNAGLRPRPLSRRFKCGFDLAAAWIERPNAVLDITSASFIAES
jgi:hypothetical protein